MNKKIEIVVLIFSIAIFFLPDLTLCQISTREQHSSKRRYLQRFKFPYYLRKNRQSIFERKQYEQNAHSDSVFSGVQDEASGQAPLVIWKKKFGELIEYQSVRATGIEIGNDGNFVFCSVLFDDWDPEMPFSRSYISKIDTGGFLLWERELDDPPEVLYPDFDDVYDLKKTSDGGFIMCGEAYSDYEGESGFFWLVKTDGDGVQQWNRAFSCTTFGPCQSNKATSIIEVSGGYVFSGIFHSFYDYPYIYNDFLIKTNANGYVTWDRTFGNGNDEGIRCVAPSQDGGYIFCGWIDTSDTDWGIHEMGWLGKTNANGQLIWQKFFNDRRFNYVQPTSDNGYIVCGSKNDQGLLLATDQNGNKVWEKTIGGEYSSFSSVKVLANGDFLTCGSVHLSSSGDWNGRICQIDSDGNVIWSITIDDGSNERLDDVEMVSDGSIIACGGSYPYSWVVKLKGPSCSITVIKPNGGEVWEEESTHQIQWTSENTCGTVKIELSKDGGNTWNTVVSSTSDDGSYSWVLPQIQGDRSNCYIRVQDVNNSSCYDISDNSFTMKNIEPCQITVTSPNGGENWEEQSTHEVLWTSQNTSGNMKIAYSLDAGGNWSTIVGSTSDDGSYSWTLPAVNSDQSQCLIKISDAGNSSCSDESDGYFTITSSCELGDVNMDGSLTPGDALCAFMIYLNNGQAEGECNTRCALSASDANCDGSVTPGDALLIFLAYLNDQDPPLECPPAATFKAAAKEPVLEIPDIRLNATQQEVEIPIYLRQGAGVDAFGFELNYPARILDYVALKRGDLTYSWSELSAQLRERGILAVGGFSETSLSADQSSGELLKVVFRVKSWQGTDEKISLFNLTDDFQFAQTRIGTIEPSASNQGSVPDAYRLSQNFPNPFNMTTDILYELPRAGFVKIVIYNSVGAIVRTLVSNQREAGRYVVQWDGCDDRGNVLGSGVYFCQMTTAEFRKMRKILLLK